MEYILDINQIWKFKELQNASHKESKEIINNATKTLRIAITGRCNLKCPFCYAEGIGLVENGIPVDTPEALKMIGGDMSYDFAASIIKGAASAGFKAIIFTGGEPTVYKKLFELAQLAETLGLAISITTNGLFLDKLDLKAWSLFKEFEFHISVHTLDNKEYDQIHGVKGKGKEFLSKLSKNLEYLKQYKIQYKFNMVVETLNQLENNWEVIEKAKELKVPVKILGVHDSPTGGVLSSAKIQQYLVSIGGERLKSEHNNKINYGYDAFIIKGAEVRILNFLYGKGCIECPIGGCGEGIRYLRVFPTGIIDPCLGIKNDYNLKLEQTDTVESIGHKLKLSVKNLERIGAQPYGIDKLIKEIDS